jgi:hypothetical protein
LRDGARPGVGSDDHHHRNSDAVEAGHVGDAGDAHVGEQWLQARERVLGGADAMRAEGVALEGFDAVLGERHGRKRTVVGRHGVAAISALASRTSGVSRRLGKLA